jgi:tetratricopeptide (TPR) repeat protein
LQDLARLDEALASFDLAIAIQADNARAHNNRGVALQDLQRFAEALASHDRAIALKPEFAEAYYNRAMALHALKRFDEAIAGFGKAIALRPDYAQAYHNLGVVLQDCKRVDDAIAAYKKAIALKPDSTESHFNLGFCLLHVGRYEQGWPLHEWRLQIEELSGRRRSFAQPRWRGGEDIAGKTLFVYREQGFGDTLQFCRYGRLLQNRGIKTVMSVQEPLYRLLQQMSPDVEIIHDGALPAAFDYHCPLLSLPLAFGTTLDTIPAPRPYIFADRALRDAWAARLPPCQRLSTGQAKPRIGIAWSGNKKQKNDHNRSMTLRTLAPLLSDDAQWISLQKDLRPGDADLLKELPVVSFTDELADFADAAAVLDSLDLVITVDTSVAHLAGAMGKPVWIMLTYYPDWRWLLDRDDCPWYPTARLFRQDETRSWENVIARVRDAMHEFVKSRPPA